jgi:putative glutamine amidotransferase
MSTPLIGITAERSQQKTAFGLRDCTLQLLNYADAVVAAGGRPALLPATETVPDGALDGFDGLLLTGGGDLSPELYGAVADESVYGVSPVRDRFETVLIEEAQERGIPILAICRGLQLINVIRGGSLLLDVKAHWQKRPPDEADHDVRIEPDSSLARVVGDTTLAVNSYHHQAIDQLGTGLRVVGYSGDIIEAVDDVEHGIIAVQWHPEHLFRVSDQNLALFSDLVGRAREYKERNLINV